MASSLAIGRWSIMIHWGSFFRGFLCAGGVDSGLGEVEDDVEVLGSDFVGRGSSELGECSIFFGIGSSSSILTWSDGTGDGRPSSVEQGGSRILTGSDSMYILGLDGDVEECSSKVMEDVEAKGKGLLSSTLRAMARNLDMARAGRQHATKQGA